MLLSRVPPLCYPQLGSRCCFASTHCMSGVRTGSGMPVCSHNFHRSILDLSNSRDAHCNWCSHSCVRADGVCICVVCMCMFVSIRHTHLVESAGPNMTRCMRPFSGRNCRADKHSVHNPATRHSRVTQSRKSSMNLEHAYSLGTSMHVTHSRIATISRISSTMSGINFAMDKCDEGHSEWKGWWGTLAGIHMLVGVVFLLAPTNVIPYQGESLLPGLYQPSASLVRRCYMVMETPLSHRL